jgi:hypothetical protein
MISAIDIMPPKRICLIMSHMHAPRSKCGARASACARGACTGRVFATTILRQSHMADNSSYATSWTVAFDDAEAAAEEACFVVGLDAGAAGAAGF